MSLSGTIRLAFFVLTRLPGHKRLIRKSSERFFAGELFRDALGKTLELQKMGFGVILNNVGDDAGSEDETWAAAGINLGMLREINRERLIADVSWKLSRLSLGIFDRLDHRPTNFPEILSLIRLARILKIKVWWDAEELKTRDSMWKLGEYLLEREADFLGMALQAYGAGKYDSKDFLKSVVMPFIRRTSPEKTLAIRLCKGAYQKSEEKGSIITDPITLHIRYLELAETILAHIAESLTEHQAPRLYIELATHDLELIWKIQAFVKRLSSKHKIELGLLKSYFRFAMLLGKQEAEASHLVTEGWNTYIYVPFGLEQIPYILRRIEEKPEYALWGLKKEGEYHRCENSEQCRSRSQT